jgi:hypothetical protein
MSVWKKAELQRNLPNRQRSLNWHRIHYLKPMTRYLGRHRRVILLENGTGRGIGISSNGLKCQQEEKNNAINLHTLETT